MISPSLHAYNEREKNNYFLGFKLDRNKRKAREREKGPQTVSTANETNHRKVCVCACSLFTQNMKAKSRYNKGKKY